MNRAEPEAGLEPRATRLQPTGHAAEHPRAVPIRAGRMARARGRTVDGWPHSRIQITFSFRGRPPLHGPTAGSAVAHLPRVTGRPATGICDSSTRVSIFFFSSLTT